MEDREILRNTRKTNQECGRSGMRTVCVLCWKALEQCSSPGWCQERNKDVQCLDFSSY